jgi:hypothetical protein
VKLEHQIKMHELFAHFHMTRANTGDYKRDKTTDGHGVPLTDERKLAGCISAAKQHIKYYVECAELINSASNEYE